VKIRSLTKVTCLDNIFKYIV